MSVLLLMDGEPPDQGSDERFWTVEQLTDASPLPETLVPLCVAALKGRGLAEDYPGAMQSGTCQVSALGMVVLALLKSWA